MKASSKLFGIVGAILISAVVIVLFNLFWNREQATADDRSAPQLVKKAVPGALPSAVPQAGTSMDALLQTPINFCGLVLDQNQVPVEGAIVSATVLNNLSSGTQLSTSSSADGTFTIRSNGTSLHVNVKKEGFHDVDHSDRLKPSSQGFDFAADTGRGVHKSDPANPVVFHLVRPVKPAALERLNGQMNIPRNGTSVPVALKRNGNPVLKVKCESEAHADDSSAPFDWRCEIFVDGGGIVEAVESTSHLAPDQGYSSSAVISMPKNLGPKRWRDAEMKNYWIRFPDNTFGKIRFRMIAGGDHFAVIDGYWNPSPNDRNLEPRAEGR